MASVSLRYHCLVEKNHYKRAGVNTTLYTPCTQPRKPTIRMTLPIVLARLSARSSTNRNTIFALTWRSTAVRLMGATVAFLFNFSKILEIKYQGKEAHRISLVS